MPRSTSFCIWSATPVLAKRSSTLGSVFPGPGPAASVAGISSGGKIFVMGTPSGKNRFVNAEVQSSSRQDALRQDWASTDFGALEPLPNHPQGTRGKGRSPERGERGFFH